MTALASTNASTPQKNSSRPSRLLLTGGLALISLGAVWLATSALLGRDNWWAIFILAPAVALLAGAGLLWQASGGHYNFGVRLALLAGLPTLLTALIFMLRIDWSIGWTLMLMLLGLTVLANGFTRPGLAIGSFGRAVTDSLFWLGVAVGLAALFTRDWSLINLVVALGALIVGGSRLQARSAVQGGGME